MGCGNAKVKIEDELMILKLERAQIQMERVNQLKLLDEIGGGPFKPANIPDYVAPNGINKESNNNIGENLKKPTTRSLSKRNRSLVVKRKSKQFKSLKRKTVKYNSSKLIK